MFPLPILTYVKVAMVVLALCGAFYSGYRLEANRFDLYKARQVAEQAEIEKKHQAAADEIRKEKDAQITAINNQLVDAISQLRKRPSRSQGSSDGQSGTGATLYAEDAEFLIREAARADQIRAGLQACYAQYDAIAK